MFAVVVLYRILVDLLLLPSSIEPVTLQPEPQLSNKPAKFSSSERIDDMVRNMKYFSPLTLAFCYWQVKMSDVSKKKTAFVTQHGLFEFLVMQTPLQSFKSNYPMKVGIYNIWTLDWSGLHGLDSGLAEVQPRNWH